MILNLTQHPATPDQIAAGVVDLVGDDLAQLKRLLTFDTPPDGTEIRDRAEALAILAGDAFEGDAGEMLGNEAMIGGAPFFMSALEQALQDNLIFPMYAFSQRVVQEQPQPDGTVKKVAMFQHAGWVRPWAK